MTSAGSAGGTGPLARGAVQFSHEPCPYQLSPGGAAQAPAVSCLALRSGKPPARAAPWQPAFSFAMSPALLPRQGQLLLFGAGGSGGASLFVTKRRGQRRRTPQWASSPLRACSGPVNCSSVVPNLEIPPSGEGAGWGKDRPWAVGVRGGSGWETGCPGRAGPGVLPWLAEDSRQEAGV